MYCSACASPVTAGLKFCNRCGANLSRDGAETQPTGNANGLITGSVLIAICGLGIMFAGALVLKKGGDLNNDVVGLFMFFCFVIVGITEIFLLRQLARALGHVDQSRPVENAPPLFQPAPMTPLRELRAVRDTAEPISSVTENTTRTLEHSIRDISR